jgi:hypothetical protein
MSASESLEKNVVLQFKNSKFESSRVKKLNTSRARRLRSSRSNWRELGENFKRKIRTNLVRLGGKQDSGIR